MELEALAEGLFPARGDEPSGRSSYRLTPLLFQPRAAPKLVHYTVPRVRGDEPQQQVNNQRMKDLFPACAGMNR